MQINNWASGHLWVLMRAGRQIAPRSYYSSLRSFWKPMMKINEARLLIGQWNQSEHLSFAKKKSTVAVMFATVAALEVFKALTFLSNQNGLLNSALPAWHQLNGATNGKLYCPQRRVWVCSDNTWHQQTCKPCKICIDKYILEFELPVELRTWGGSTVYNIQDIQKKNQMWLINTYNCQY